MFSGGNVIVAVSTVDVAAQFYTARLGLTLTHRFGNRWVTIDAGPSYWATDEPRAGLALGLQPHMPDESVPGTRGSVGFGLETCDPLESLVTQCAARGVGFTSEIIAFEGGRCITLDDADGNGTYLWEVTEDMLPEEDRRRKDGGSESAAGSITGGHALVFVSNMDRAVAYYTEVLGLPLTNRYENKIATVEAGRRLVIALHPTKPGDPAPGTRGASRLALHVDEPIDRVLSRLAARGVRMAGATSGTRERGSAVIEDLDGNPIEIVEQVALKPHDEGETSGPGELTTSAAGNRRGAR